MVLAWLQANAAGVTAAVVALVMAYLNRNKIKEKLGIKPKMAAVGDGFSFDNIAAKVKEFLESLGNKGDAVKRSVHLGMLVVISTLR